MTKAADSGFICVVDAASLKSTREQYKTCLELLQSHTPKTFVWRCVQEASGQS